ncbi:DUF6114 domain-containing protein [uncultured Corynebacterium sp.]|uniref:DUF6114 domain-containing protein n=1 Tax=uncultured Corynebacterium sp. TaxID=159447 RepID=UPI00259516F3|nr:DUF6114 domain-containing protein [uncultured Corynebacterium sp.]
MSSHASAAPETREFEALVDAHPAALAPTQRRRFREWAAARPFRAGLFVILGGTVILTPAYLSFEVSNLQVQISTMSGVSTLLIGVLLIASGLMTWFQREGRILTGLTALILGVVAVPTSNFGGFMLGSLLAIVGGALALSWTAGAPAEEEP